ncbi:GGDEF domain-containing protein [Achromobacter sp. UMC71]|uniref:GGDEF domain-containing protein n=1 Tax=Achromobacter sp. UMC71 TaxID=1862320 RepID=UPI0016027C92|nr:diguanylate cyclase [Achromobacter sp. UMC71]MBB1624695.1 histidine kinase [Achromobacter sp. UMC71]
MRLVSSNDALISPPPRVEAGRPDAAEPSPPAQGEPVDAGAARDAELRHLRELVARYEALFQNAPVLINAFDERGRCLLWNDACVRRFGWTCEEINAYPEPLALFYPDPEIRARVLRSVGPTPVQSFREWQPLARDGERLSVMWSNVRLPDGSVINIGMDMTENRRNEAALARLAKVDDLTGCWTRAEILQRMQTLLEAARRGARHTALMLDLDYFKQVNDRYGHLGGDAALRHFCEQLQGCLREGDAVGRLGGEEFVVLLADADADVALAVCDRLRAGLRQHPASVDGHAVVLSASGGITRFLQTDASMSDVLRRADQALYRAKRAGRDCAVVLPD